MGIPALFEARGGISIGIHVITGDGVPGGGGGRPDDAIKGSIFMDQTNGQMYVKKQTGTGADKWVRNQNQEDLDAALLGQSWREPVKLYDSSVYADLAAAEVAVNTGAIDATAIADGDRILFDGIAGQNANVFIVTGTPGVGAVLVEEGNDATKGDAIYIRDGSVAGRKYAYNGSDWVQSGAAERTELGYLRNFIGKSSEGSELPEFASNNIIDDGDTLEVAAGKLDAEVGAAVATPQGRTAGPISDQAVNLNVEALDDAIGPNATSSNQLTPASTVNANLSSLDQAVGDDVTGPKARTVGAVSAQDINSNIEALDSAIGADVTSSKHIAAANEVNVNLSILDDVLGDAKTETKSDSVTTVVTVDSVVVDDVLAAEWTVHARSSAAATNLWAGKILALHNGTASADATDVDYNTFAILKSGSAISTLDFEVDLDGTGAAQVMRLRVSSGQAANIRVTRAVLNEQ